MKKMKELTENKGKKNIGYIYGVVILGQHVAFFKGKSCFEFDQKKFESGHRTWIKNLDTTDKLKYTPYFLHTQNQIQIQNKFYLLIVCNFMLIQNIPVLDLVKNMTPLYIYDTDIILRQINRLKSAFDGLLTDDPLCLWSLK